MESVGTGCTALITSLLLLWAGAQAPWAGNFSFYIFTLDVKTVFYFTVEVNM
jgi:hypothetical protein